MKCSDDSLFWIEILSVKGVSSWRWLRLGAHLSPRRIVSMLRSGPGRKELERHLARPVERPDGPLMDKQLRFIERKGCGALCISDPDYPELLREIQDPPPLIFITGDGRLMKRPPVCVVGSRRASRRGLVTARRIAEGLSSGGIPVVSGMARGIDSAAHEGAVAGGGGTCAVLGCGVDVPYPPENVSLAMEIAANGCLLSEFPPGTPPLRHHFPRRNRILSGLALGVVVVEAGIESGAMGTAKWAADQGREVMAVPGPVEIEGSRGPHRLIKEGACLVETVDDIVDAVRPDHGRSSIPDPGRQGSLFSRPVSFAPGRRGELEREICRALELDPKHIDEISQICHISAASILPILLELEIRGIVESCGGGTFSIGRETRRRGAGGI